MRRGGCSFSQKLANIPSFAPNRNSLQLVVIVSDDGGGDHGDHTEKDPDNKRDSDEHNEDDSGHDERGEKENIGFDFIRPLLEERQKTPAGILRHNPIPMLMVGGGEEAYQLLQATRSLGIRRRYHVESQGLQINNLVVL